MGSWRAQIHAAFYLKLIHLTGIMKGVVAEPARRICDCDLPAGHHVVAYLT